MNESQKCVELKKLEAAHNELPDTIYINCPDAAYTETESGLMVAEG